MAVAPRVTLVARRPGRPCCRIRGPTRPRDIRPRARSGNNDLGRRGFGRPGAARGGAAAALLRWFRVAHRRRAGGSGGLAATGTVAVETPRGPRGPAGTSRRYYPRVVGRPRRRGRAAQFSGEPVRPPQRA